MILRNQKCFPRVFGCGSQFQKFVWGKGGDLGTLATRHVCAAEKITRGHGLASDRMRRGTEQDPRRPDLVREWDFV
jgi:hypothetical protein